MGTHDYEKELDSWKEEFKKQWDYERSQVKFIDGNGNVFTQAPPSTTSTTTTSTVNPITSIFPTYKPVVVTNITTTTPRSEGSVSNNTSTDLLKLIGITAGVLFCFVVIIGFFILLCKGYKKKRDRNISVRRPLEGPEPEEHIYAEIEPLQLGRTQDSEGASGTTSDIPLPERKRRRGVSSFSGISTRIQKFFSIRKPADSQSVFYIKRNGESVMHSVTEAPEPPQRNMNGNHRRDKPKKVQRGESTASQRPLLDGDSQISQPSTSSDFRDSTYNALLKKEDIRQSGPYDTLNKQMASDDSADNDPPSSPHDYFTLEKNKFPFNEDSPVYNGGSDIVTIEQDPGNMETIEEADAESETEEAAQPHEYFILKPHEREKSTKGKSDDNNSPGDLSEMSGEVDKGDGNVASGSEKFKPTPKPRLNKEASGEKSPNHKGEIEPSNENSDNKKMNEYIAYNAMSARRGSKEDDYEISKFGEAPKPPQKNGGMGDAEEEENNDYLLPVEEKARVYVDVFPNPPPRSTSLLHDSSLSDSQQKDLLAKTKDSPSSYQNSA